MIKYRKLLGYLITLLILCMQNIAFAASELEKNKTYKLKTGVFEIRKANVIGIGPLPNYSALKNSRFIVIGIDDNYYTVHFEIVYTGTMSGVQWVTRDQPYLIPKKILNKSLQFSEVTDNSLVGLSSGPLFIPFKYRLDDKSLAGDSTIGMYAGVTYDLFCDSSAYCFQFTPIVSAGVSQVSVLDGTDVDEKTGATLAVGFLVQNWKDVNIGLVYGQDRVGDSGWVHEGKGWVSFMIGWKL